MAVKIGDKVFRNEQEQVQKNMKDIEVLKQYIKEAYKCSSELTSATDQVLKSSTNAGEDVTSGWLMDSIGNLFTITGGDDTYLLLDFFTSLRGPQGEAGTGGSEGEQGPAGQDGQDGYSVHYSSDDYDSNQDDYFISNLQSQNQVNSNDVIIFKNGYLCRVYNVTTTPDKIWVSNPILLSIPSATQSYLHNIHFRYDSVCKFTLTLINSSETKINSFATLKQALIDKGYFSNSKYPIVNWGEIDNSGTPQTIVRISNMSTTIQFYIYSGYSGGASKVTPTINEDYVSCWDDVQEA